MVLVIGSPAGLGLTLNVHRAVRRASRGLMRSTMKLERREAASAPARSRRTVARA